MSVEVGSKSLSPWAPEFRHISFRGSIARDRFVYGHEPWEGNERGKVTLSEDEESFLRFLFKEAGLDLYRYRLKTIKRRIGACLRTLHANSFADARRVVQQKPALLPAAISTMVIGVTSFFRDGPVFEMLRNEVIPTLFKGRYGLAIWCAGCSDGPELYSLAMMLAEMKLLHRCHLLGTDCRWDAVRRARAGQFDAAAIKSVPAELLARYFTQQETHWRVKSVIRDAIHWRRADVLTLHEPGIWDLILCRNMTMYLTPEASAALFPRLEMSLRSAGALVLGKAERPLAACHLSTVGPCMYRRDR
ncbi:MAG TPA: protein-glutamate O-methyltransferase CheR [Tepidisphaeraceae bacterium]|jgi:chemotaxis protein methyltransferase CheR|nr:protein-glutamate O-methyltransferase CheR [Tepidisphaeraceae bacterium]